MPSDRAVLGLLLAAGAGRRMGMPKALLRDERGRSFLLAAVDALLEGGCDRVCVVLGARADEARQVLAGHPGPVDVVPASDWEEGMGASLRAGLATAEDMDASSALVGLVDLPDVGPDVVRRMLERLTPDRTTLARATYDGVPGHPVLIGRDHWAGVAASAEGDRGARDYLARHPATEVECGDLATGRDVDTPDEL